MQNILVVEDDVMSRNLLIEGLQDCYLKGAAEVLGADSYDAAVELIKNRSNSVLGTDMFLQ